MQATILAYMTNNQATINFLEKKHQAYPKSSMVALTYNNFLLTTNPRQATTNLRKLSTDNPDNIWINIQLAVFLNDYLSNDNLDLYNQQLKTINNSKVSAYFVDSHISNMQNAMNLKSMQVFAKPILHFNPMNYHYLLLSYINAQTDDQKINFLKNLETIDPYDTYVLIELANYYDKHDMNKELSEIKQRFNSSLRYKTKEEIKIMSQY